MNRRPYLLLLVCAAAALVLVACDDDESDPAGTDATQTTDDATSTAADGTDPDTSTGPVDITGAVFSSRDADCAAYAGSYTATATDLGANATFNASVEIVDDGDRCSITSNAIPNHDVNDQGAFATPVGEVTETYSIPKNPTAAASPTPLSLQYDNAVFLNGAKLDLLAAACYGVGNEPLGQEKIGCFEDGTPWRYDPMFEGNDFGTDSNNAHTQPDGAYHYHGDPGVMYDPSGAAESGVIGFAADGFPIFGPFIDDNGTIRRVVSGYTIVAGSRVSQTGEGAFPGGNPDGKFVDDYEFTDAGDLDECNGMERDGQYGYYVTDGYPWVLGCFRGTPDESFRKMMP